MNKKNALLIKITALVVLSSPFLGIGSLSISARTLEEINQEIKNQQSDLEKTQEELKKAEEELQKSKKDLESAQSGLPQLEAEISAIEAEMNLNKSKLSLIEQEKQLKELEKTQKELQQKSSLRSSYMQWRTQNPIINTIVETQYDFKKNETYTSKILSGEHADILGLITNLSDINLQIDEYNDTIAKLDVQNQELIAKKRQLEEQIAYLNSIYAGNSVQVNSLKTLSQNIESQLGTLLEEQKVAYQKETWILEQNNQPTTPPPPPPPPQNDDGDGQNEDPPPPPQSTFYFTGQGRDLYQGHGVGLSQWGAYGGANAGMSAVQILKFYYTGVDVVGGYENATINVQGYGVKSIDDYVAGQGEVPGRACGNQDQANARPDKYVVDNPNTAWDCWPEEAIKAQVIAYRSYALNYVGKYGSICTTAACQVYNGTTYTKWAADETKGMVMLSAGRVIEALYSSDNSQGHGTANNDTIWQNIYGDGTPYSYLRAVNDTGFAATTGWTYWYYETVGRYTYSDVSSMLDFIINQSPDYSSSIKSQLAGVRNSVGEISSIEFERDASLRVKKVWLIGTSGARSSIGGWWFKNIWNNWSYYVGRYDYIYSQTFFLN